METKELKITIPEGFEIDREKSSFEKIVFKEKDTKPRSWEEFLIKHNHKTRNPFLTLPNENMAKASRAMMQLMSIRQDWIGDWEPDWTNERTIKWCIAYQIDNIYVFEYRATSRPLSFPTNEMAIDFMNTFKDLLEIAKPLI